jgi:hypothetical protein
LLANKELAENAKTSPHSMFKVAVVHDLMHYHIRESKFKDSEKWGETVTFYEENEKFILKVFRFLKTQVIKKNNKGETYKENVYSEKQRPEEFIVEAIALLEAGYLDKNNGDEEYIKMVKFVEEVYNSLKGNKK